VTDTRVKGSPAVTFTQGHGLDGPWGIVAGKKQCVRNSLHAMISVTSHQLALLSQDAKDSKINKFSVVTYLIFKIN